jgi:hypothetical protein
LQFLLYYNVVILRLPCKCVFWKLQLLNNSTSFQFLRTRLPRTRAKYGKANFIDLSDEDEDTPDEEEEEENIRSRQGRQTSSRTAKVTV